MSEHHLIELTIVSCTYPPGKMPWECEGPGIRTAGKALIDPREIVYLSDHEHDYRVIRMKGESCVVLEVSETVDEIKRKAGIAEGRDG